ncbi:MAG TPA: hypothetical protein VMU82_10565 [Acetobacteraceae bacterium]|nr:hypothetical protein [Acetobacteraceae bacterium]
MELLGTMATGIVAMMTDGGPGGIAATGIDATARDHGPGRNRD